MAIITCPECGKKEVSDTTSACPNCGFNVRNYFYQKQMAKWQKESDEEDRLIRCNTCPKCRNRLSEKIYYEPLCWQARHKYNEIILKYCLNCRWEKKTYGDGCDIPPDGADIRR